MRTKTPLRVSFSGGGTDFPEFYEREPGAALSTTIDKYVRISVEEPVADCCELECACFDAVGAPYRSVVTTSDLPGRTGLGSSSAFVVGLLKALHNWRSPYFLFDAACQVERETLFQITGVQDQFAAAYGGFQLIQFNANGVSAERVEPLPGLADHLALYFTGITRHSSMVQSRLREQMDARRPQLRALRDIAYRMVDAQGIDAFSRLLQESWNIKRSMGTSNAVIDRMAHAAIRAGAMACKLLGAGSGGFLLVMRRPEHASAVQAAVNRPEIRFAFDPEGSRAETDDTAVVQSAG